MSEVDAIAQRWEGFLGKVRQRVDEVLAEADAGFDELIATEVVDPAPMSAAGSAFRARMDGLSQKIEESWNKIEGELEAAGAPGGSVDELHRKGAALCFEIECRRERMRISKESAAARRLLELAKAEMAEAKAGAACKNCGAKLEPEELAVASNATCGHCSAVTTLVPGMATAMFYAGTGPHSLAEGDALELWLGLLEVERSYDGKRNKSAADFEALEKASLAYWQAYFRTYGQHRPGFTKEQEAKELEGRMSWVRMKKP